MMQHLGSVRPKNVNINDLLCLQFGHWTPSSHKLHIHPMQAYVRQQAEYLSQLQDGHSNAECFAGLERCRAEVMGFVFCHSMGNPDAMRNMFSLNMQDGSYASDPESQKAKPADLVSALLLCSLCAA